MASILFSKHVLMGLKMKGLTQDGAARIAETSEARIRFISIGKGSFTDGQLNAIELATGLTAGQLAMSAVKPDKALRSVIAAGARLNRGMHKLRRKAKRAVL